MLNSIIFTAEELELIRIYWREGMARAELIEKISGAVPETEEQEMRDILGSSIKALEKIPEAEYAEINFG